MTDISVTDADGNLIGAIPPVEVLQTAPAPNIPHAIAAVEKLKLSIVLTAADKVALDDLSKALQGL